MAGQGVKPPEAAKVVSEDKPAPSLAPHAPLPPCGIFPFPFLQIIAIGPFLFFLDEAKGKKAGTKKKLVWATALLAQGARAWCAHAHRGPRRRSAREERKASKEKS